MASIGQPVNRGHEFLNRVERNFRHAGIVGSHGVRIQSGLVGQYNQGAFHGVPAHAPEPIAGLEFGVIAQDGHLGQFPNGLSLGLRDRLPVAQKFPVWLITVTRDLDVPACRDDLRDHHLVARQGAGLVRTDDRHGTESFDSGHEPDDGLARCHPTHP